VAKGKEGASGIYDSWAEASVMVNGVSGAIYRKFREYEDAWDFVQRYLDSVASSRNSGTIPKVIKEVDEDVRKEDERHKRAAAELALQTPIECKTAPFFGSAVSAKEAMHTMEATNSFLPLLELAGPDSSTKKEDPKRTSLKELRSLERLRKRIKVLLKL
jgi:hypothetical protein